MSGVRELARRSPGNLPTPAIRKQDGRKSKVPPPARKGSMRLRLSKPPHRIHVGVTTFDGIPSGPRSVVLPPPH